MAEGQLSLSITERERQVQIKEARRLSMLDVATTQPAKSSHYQAQNNSKQPFKKKFTPKGHDAILKDFQAKNTPVFIESIGGDLIEGVVTASDRYTISIRDKDGNIETIYKHGIFSFGKQSAVEVKNG